MWLMVLAEEEEEDENSTIDTGMQMLKRATLTIGNNGR